MTKPPMPTATPTAAPTASTPIEQGGNPAAIARAAALLREGELVAFPTETVYGLGADATNDRAVARIYEAKGRPHFNPLIAHVPDLDAVAALVRVTALAEELAAAFWPGPLTLVLQKRAECPVSLLASAGLDTLAVRIPAQPVALALLRAVGVPVVAPSANLSGRVSPTTPLHVKDELDGRCALILASGRCGIGLESTILDLTTPSPLLLRPGGAPVELIEARIGAVARHAGDPTATPQSDGLQAPILKAPGMLASHYAPRLPVRLDAAMPLPGEGWLSFGPVLAPAAQAATAHLSLSETGDLAEAAANLFAFLRALDRPDLAGIAVAPIPHTGLGLAINDRLGRAAAPRNAR